MKRAAGCMAALALAGAASAADENKDLDLIPQATPPARQEEKAPPRIGSANDRVFIQNALGFSSVRGDLLVASPPPPRWEERLFGDARLEWPAGPHAFVAYSGRLTARFQEGLGYSRTKNLTHDLREIYASVEPRPREYVDVGRINVKSGVALGFNPTDLFKARAVVDPLTADPSALREDRLGTLMIRAQRVGEGGSLAAAYAPKVADPAPVAAIPDRGLRPLFDHTNGADRWLVKASAQLGGGFNPEAVLHHESGRTKIGLNLTESVGQASVVYLEWSGGRRLGIVDEALAFARQTSTIPAAAPNVMSQGGDERFMSQVAVGASYTSENKITFNLEYHYNEAGFSRADWSRWFALGDGQPASSPTARQLWYIRAYASDRQEPLQQHAVFLRMNWVDFLVPKLELTGFVLADARDGSTLLQLGADYARTDLWSFGVLAGGTAGGKHSNFGSLPREASILFKATRYF